jgi:hypothetical protein
MYGCLSFRPRHWKSSRSLSLKNSRCRSMSNMLTPKSFWISTVNSPNMSSIAQCMESSETAHEWYSSVPNTSQSDLASAVWARCRSGCVFHRLEPLFTRRTPGVSRVPSGRPLLERYSQKSLEYAACSDGQNRFCAAQSASQWTIRSYQGLSGPSLGGSSIPRSWTRCCTGTMGIAHSLMKQAV